MKLSRLNQEMRAFFADLYEGESKPLVLGEGSENVVLSARNIPNVETAPVSSINVYDILKYNTVITTKAAVASIEEVYA